MARPRPPKAMRAEKQRKVQEKTKAPAAAARAPSPPASPMLRREPEGSMLLRSGRKPAGVAASASAAGDVAKAPGGLPTTADAVLAPAPTTKKRGADAAAAPSAGLKSVSEEPAGDVLKQGTGTKPEEAALDAPMFSSFSSKDPQYEALLVAMGMHHPDDETKKKRRLCPKQGDLMNGTMKFMDIEERADEVHGNDVLDVHSTSSGQKIGCVFAETVFVIDKHIFV